MAVSVQVFGGCIRDHGSAGEYGDAFSWSCAFQSDPERPHVAILCGVTKPPSMETLVRGAAALSALGFSVVRYSIKGVWHEHDAEAFLRRRQRCLAVR